MSRFSPKFNTLILDGGTGHLLKSKPELKEHCQGLKFEDQFAAGAIANLAHPNAVQQVHHEYLAAGADIITANTFGCTQWSLAKVGRSDEALDLAVAAAKIAKEEAASVSGRRVLVAGSLPPLEESYQVHSRQEMEVLQPEYNALAAALSPHVDILLCETMPSIADAMAAATAASLLEDMPVWVSYTLHDNEKAVLRSGESLVDAVAAVGVLPGVEAVLLNCCAPQAITAGLTALWNAVPAAPAGLTLGAYANGFSTTTSEWLAQGSSEEGASPLRLPAEEYDPCEGTILPAAYLRHARQWVQLGATVIGGCCGVGPHHVAELAHGLREGGGASLAARGKK